MSLRQLAADMGLKVETRPVPVEELHSLEEAGACGTAAVITPIGEITDRETGEKYTFGKEPGTVSTKLYQTLQGMQYGDIPDKFGWIHIIK